MDIPLHARVDCADGECGESTYVIVDPTTHRVTDFVVQAGGFPNQEWLVPLDMVVQTEQDRIVIRVDGKDLPNLKPFTVSEFLPGSEPIDPYPAGGYMVWPSMAPETSIEVETQQIPPNTVAIPHGAEVKATDGDVGKVDEFLIDPLSNKITHMVIHEGVLWNKREVTIPVEEIDRITENTVFLKVDKYTVEHLPDRKA
jgi:uncharacterized protein YrrD